MKHISVDKIPATLEEMKLFVNRMEINTYYDFVGFQYKWIKIEERKDYFSKETYFSWSKEHNHSVSGYVGYAYPLKNYNTIQKFKTLAGAKRSLVKSFKRHYERMEA